MDLDLGLEGSVAVITGAGGQIGQVIVDAFLAAGCLVGALDIDPSKFNKKHEDLYWIQADTTDEAALQAAWTKVAERFGGTPVICVAAAGLDLSFIEHHTSIVDMSVEQFRHTLDVNTTGTFVTAKTWLRGIQQITSSFGESAYLMSNNASLIIIGSEAGVLGVPGNPDYAASKSAIQYGLTLSLAPDAARINNKARVNAIAPGAVDTPQFGKECAEDTSEQVRWLDSESTVASSRAVEMEHVARLCLMLASEKWSGSTTGQVIRVDAGKSGRVFWKQGGSPAW